MGAFATGTGEQQSSPCTPDRLGEHCCNVVIEADALETVPVWDICVTRVVAVAGSSGGSAGVRHAAGVGVAMTRVSSTQELNCPDFDDNGSL